MITQEELKKTIVYDPDTGLMRWLISPSGSYDCVPAKGL